MLNKKSHTKFELITPEVVDDCIDYIDNILIPNDNKHNINNQFQAELCFVDDYKIMFEYHTSNNIYYIINFTNLLYLLSRNPSPSQTVSTSNYKTFSALKLFGYLNPTKQFIVTSSRHTVAESNDLNLFQHAIHFNYTYHHITKPHYSYQLTNMECKTITGGRIIIFTPEIYIIVS